MQGGSPSFGKQHGDAPFYDPSKAPGTLMTFAEHVARGDVPSGYRGLVAVEKVDGVTLLVGRAASLELLPLDRLMKGFRGKWRKEPRDQAGY